MRERELYALLQVDPVLALFLSAELLPEKRLSERSLAGLAKLASPWLAIVLTPHLEQLEPEISAPMAVETAVMAAHAIQVSHVVFQLAETHRCQEPAAFELAAILLAAGSLVIPRPSSASPPCQEQFSKWIVESCHLPDVGPFCGIAATMLASESPSTKEDAPARKQIPVSPPATTELLAECTDVEEQVMSHWQANFPEALSALRKLVARLAPLEALQQDFAARLEREKLLAMKELAYGAGHEINNPLANISVRAQTLIKQETDPERKRMLAAMNGQVFRAHEMIADLMLFAQPPEMTPAPTELGELVRNLTKELQPEANRQNTLLTSTCPSEPLTVSADALQLSLAIHAMVMNSLEAIGRGGKIELLISQERLSKGRMQARIFVQDDGPGISEEVRQHLFDPFYSGREAGRGLGFGLSKCWRIVTAHGGEIEVDSSPLGGARFSILLPMEKAEPQPTGSAPRRAGKRE